MTLTKLAVCLPSRTGRIPEYVSGFLFHLGHQVGMMGVPAVHWTIGLALQDTANNAMAKACLDDPDVSHILWLEDDMSFPLDLLPRLLHHDVEMVSGTFFQRNQPFNPHAYKREPTPPGAPAGDYYRAMSKELANWKEGDGLVEVDSVGFGCVLMKRHVLTDIALSHPNEWFRRTPNKSVDFDFCEKARAIGIPIYVDFGVLCEHEMARAMVGKKHFDVTWGHLKEEEPAHVPA